jgi:hypothetical protein
LYLITAFVSRNPSKPKTPRSRPLPDCFWPPKGADKSGLAPFKAIWPARMRSATRRAWSALPEARS